jgi:hypothetical protein
MRPTQLPRRAGGRARFLRGLPGRKYAGLSFEAFKSEMKQSEEFMALSAWRRAAEASPR